MKLGVICMVSNEWQCSLNLFLVQDGNKSNKLKVDNKNKNYKFLNSQHSNTDLEGREGRRERRRKWRGGRKHFQSGKKCLCSEMSMES